MDYKILREAMTRFGQMTSLRFSKNAFVRSPFAFSLYREQIMTIVGDFSRNAPLWQVGELVRLLDGGETKILETASAVGIVDALEGMLADLLERRKGNFELLPVADQYFGIKILSRDRQNMERFFRRNGK
jgi:hypothetical protein